MEAGMTVWMGSGGRRLARSCKVRDGGVGE